MTLPVASTADLNSSHQALLTNRFAALAVVLAVLVGGMVLTGHGFDLPVLKGVLQGWVPMKPNTALAFVFIGLAMALVLALRLPWSPQHSALLRRLASVLALLPALIGLLTLVEYLSGWNPGIDTLFVANVSDPANRTHPHRMAPETAICHLLLAASLILGLLPRISRPSVIASAFCSLMLVALGISSLSTYFSPVLGVFGWLGLNVMAGDSAILFILLGSAAFLLTCTQKVFSWELGKAATTGFALGLLLLIFISLTAIRSQYQISETNHKLAQSESLYARGADTFSNIAQHQSHVLSFLLTNDLRFSQYQSGGRGSRPAQAGRTESGPGRQPDRDVAVRPLRAAGAGYSCVVSANGGRQPLRPEGRKSGIAGQTRQ